MMTAEEYAEKAREMDAKANKCLDEKVLPLYRQLALEWWALYEEAVSKDKG